MSAGTSGGRGSRARALRLAAAAGAAVAAAWAATSIAGGADPSVRLTVAFVAREGAARQVAHVRCTGSRATADGFLRRVGAARACRHARRIGAFLDRRPPRDRACTQIFGGPQRARVTGRIGARRIDRRLARRDGCEVSDYDRVVPLVPRARGG